MGKSKKKAEKKAKKAEKKRRGELLTKVAHSAGLLTGTLGRAEGNVALTPTRDLFDSIQLRRSHKRFKAAPIDRAQIQTLLEAAVLAPNHKLTEPWGFLVLGERAKQAYAEAKARIKAGSQAGIDAAAKSKKMIEEILAIPAIIAVTQTQDGDPVRREEDYAAVFMAIQNLLLAATALGLGTKIHTGSILSDALLREQLQVESNRRIVAFVDVGQPVEEVPPKRRAPVAEKTRWLD